MSRKTSEAGFTIIEVLVAAFLLALALLALVASLDNSRGLANVSEAETAMSQIAENQLESLLANSFNQTALTGIPGVTTGVAADATWTAKTTALLPGAGGWNCATSQGTGTQPNDETQTACMAVCPTTNDNAGCPAQGTIAPVVIVKDDRGNRFKVLRYVTWVNDTTCSACASPTDSSGNSRGWQGDYKRVTVGVQLLQPGTTTAVTGSNYSGPTRIVSVSAVKSDPTLSTSNSDGIGSPCSFAGVVCG